MKALELPDGWDAERIRRVLDHYENQSDADAAREDDAPWPCPDELDAVVAAPKHHRVLLENDRVRVLDTRIEPGEIVPVHTHRWPAAYHVLSWSDFVRRDAEGNVLVDSRMSKAAPPEAIWSEPLAPHSLENVGSTPLHVVSVELKG